MAARPPILALKDVRLADGPVMLFDGVDLGLEPRTRACLVGRNGTGKSTLLRILAGRLEPDGGQRFIQPGARIGLVPQEPLITGDTVLDYATAGGAEPHEAEAALETFGIAPGKSTQGLSGGEIRRVALARVFAEAPDVLLLDEPTNHLDITTIQTLEVALMRSKAAALIISHDRAFLTRVTQACFWLESRKVRRLDGDFGKFDDWSRKLAEEEAESFRRLTKAIERETYTFYRSITAQRTRNEGRARALDAMRMERQARAGDMTRAMAMTIDSGNSSGKLVAEVKGVSKTYDGRTLLKGFSTRILRGDRIAIVGPNGAGKTTLVKVLLGETPPDEGAVRLGSNLQIAYVDQARAQLAPDATLWDAFAPDGGDSILVRGQSKHVAAYAREFLFNDRQLKQSLVTLSGGERNRLLLALALAKPANVLVLDEPTNDLDMDTLDLLEELLADYDGTLILVSHDRDFIDRLATSTIALDGQGHIVETPGGWTDLIGQNPGFFDGQEAAPAIRAAAAPPKPGAKPQAKLTYKDARRLEELDRLMPKLADDIAALERKLEDPGLYGRDPQGFDALMKRLDKARADLLASEEEWLNLETLRESLS
ncbi:MAG: transporter ATP-binding protein [Caulobacteraceae bacterium]|nr:transporter ATP-binding protein [Caulobacteraceae bacterium]